MERGREGGKIGKGFMYFFLWKVPDRYFIFCFANVDPNFHLKCHLLCHLKGCKHICMIFFRTFASFKAECLLKVWNKKIQLKCKYIQYIQWHSSEAESHHFTPAPEGHCVPLQGRWWELVRKARLSASTERRGISCACVLPQGGGWCRILQKWLQSLSEKLIHERMLQK